MEDMSIEQQVPEFGAINLPDEELALVAELWNNDPVAFALWQRDVLATEVARRVGEREAARAQAGIATAVKEAQDQLPSLFS